MGSIDWPIVGTQAGLGLLLGFAIGFTAKKVLQIALIVVGVLVLILVALQNYDIISIHWQRIEDVYHSSINPPGGFETMLKAWIESLAAIIPGAGGFTAGFFWGLRKG